VKKNEDITKIFWTDNYFTGIKPTLYSYKHGTLKENIVIVWVQQNFISLVDQNW